ncbi:MAG: HAMP domain-containing sensor histidine kinase [Pseudomonadales bacterium]|jgi:two-component system sensor histidine kinase PilS (NtrC family)
MKQFDQSFLEEQIKNQRATILRIYNYYRVLIAFLFLFLFLDPNLDDFVGTVDSELFKITIISYIIINVVICITALFVNVNLLSKQTPAILVIVGDIIALTLLMFASGGVSSGLGSFLFFTLAFAGGMVHGRVSTVLPAIAFILTIYGEFYLFFLNENDIKSFFQAGLLGIVYFVTNILFQTLSQQLQKRQTEVSTLEQINRLVIGRLPTGVVVLNNNSTPKLMNQSAERFLSNPGEAGPDFDVVPESLLHAVARWQDDPSHGQATFTVTATGQELIATFSELHTPTPDADTLIFLEDSTEVQQQAQQLKLASLGRLSASIAHEIRNPLGAISHAAQLLGESESLDKSDTRLCEIIQNHSVRMNDVIENVLQLSRRKSAEPKIIMLDQWLSNFSVELETNWQERSEITVLLKPKGTAITADPLHLSQIMGNLCQNGLRYSKKKTGEPRLLILGGRDTQTGLPFLEVIDYGYGVDEELVSNLFEPFYTTETTGTGLGLHVSKELCAANHARLNYKRADTGGSSFKITFMEP